MVKNKYLSIQVYVQYIGIYFNVLLIVKLSVGHMEYTK